jgi:hypothetical protein
MGGWKFFNASGQERAARPAMVVNPMARLLQSTLQAIAANSVETQIANLAVDFDTDSMVSGNTLVIQHAGKYIIVGSTDGVTNGNWITRIKVNGVLKAEGSTEGASGGYNTAAATVTLNLSAGDVITLWAQQSDSSTHNTVPGNTYLEASKVDGALVSYVEVPSKLVGQELAYVERTTDYNSTATSEATAETVLQAPAFTADGSMKVSIEVWSPKVVPSGGYVNVYITLWESVNGGSNYTAIGYAPVTVSGATTILIPPFEYKRQRTPAAGSIVYKVTMHTPSVGGTFAAGTGASGTPAPAFLRITRAA